MTIQSQIGDGGGIYHPKFSQEMPQFFHSHFQLHLGENVSVTKPSKVKNSNYLVKLASVKSTLYSRQSSQINDLCFMS